MAKARRRTATRPPADARPTRPLPHALALLPALLVGAALYAPAMRQFFAQDDVTFLSRAAGIAPTPWSLARPLSEGVAWRVLYTVFGLDPMPYHATRLALHLINAVLVYAVGLKLLRGRGAAGVAAFLFAASSVGFTPLHWGSCIVELLVAALAVGAFLVFLDARERGRTGLLWLSAVIGVAAALAKESAVVLPAVFALAAWRTPGRPSALRSLLPSGLLFGALAVAFFVTMRMLPYGQYTGGTAYAMDLSAGHLFTNLATYLRWCVTLTEPGRDLSAVVDTGARPTGFVVLAVLALALWLQRRDSSHPAEVGTGWFALFLLPVVPLESHTYLYYMYLPWSGACWLVAAVAQRATARWPRALAIGFAVTALALYAGFEWRNVRARESMRSGVLLADKTMRESLLLANAIAGLRAGRLPPGASVGFLNPYPFRHEGVGGRTPTPGQTQIRSYIPLEGAMRQGESLRLFFPGTRYLGFSKFPPPEWDDAELYLYEPEGQVTRLGRGPEALAEFAELMRAAGRVADADSLLRRVRGRSGDSPARPRR